MLSTSTVGTACTTSCGNGAVCNRTVGKCAACRVSDDCASPTDRCSSASCVAAMVCSSDHDCQGAGLVCDTTDARCVDCNSAGDCATKQACVGHSCIAAQACTSSKQCPSGLLCAAALAPAFPAAVLGMACQECGADTDCPSGSGCTNGLCVEICQQNDVHCGSFNGITCGTCSDDGQCLTPNGCESLFVPYPSSGDPAVNLVSGAGELTVESGNGIYHVDTKTGVWTLLDGSPQSPAMLANNSTDAFWISLDSQGATSVKMAPLAGGAVTTVVPSSTSVSGIERDAADVGHFYGVQAPEFLHGRWRAARRRGS